MAQIEMSFQEPKAKNQFWRNAMNSAIFHKRTNFHFIGEINYKIQSSKKIKPN